MKALRENLQAVADALGIALCDIVMSAAQPDNEEHAWAAADDRTVAGQNGDAHESGTQQRAGVLLRDVAGVDRTPVVPGRYLGWAAHGLCHASVIAAVVRHLTHPSAETTTVLELPAVLASTFGLCESFTFRANASQAFRDSMEVVLQHRANHRSRRGEEAADLVARWSWPYVLADTLLYSDLDHPALKHLIQTIWPRGRSHEITLSDLLLADSSLPPDSILERYLSALSNTRCSAILVPHVAWLNGAVLPVSRIAAALRRQDPLVTIIVDGAQAVGHLPISIETCHEENSNIDFYIGCGHKWIGGPEAVGFARVGQRFTRQCRECAEFLASSDLLSDTRVKNVEFLGEQIGTNQRGMAKGLLQALRSKEFNDAFYTKLSSNAERLRVIVATQKSLSFLGPPPSCRSAIVAFMGATDEVTSAMRRRLEDDGFFCCLYRLPNALQTPDQTLFVRLSPGPCLTEQELDEFARCVQEVRK
jgi:selenocysteine lyase/cysteine desulfurase